jgi:hypothetical protein
VEPKKIHLYLHKLTKELNIIIYSSIGGFMGAVGDKYVLTLTSQYIPDGVLGNPLINVFAYEATSGTPSAMNLIDAFATIVLDLLTDVLSSETNVFGFDVVNLDDLGDFASVSNAHSGAVTGDNANVFVGWEFEYLRAVRGVHNGRKTFGVIAESSITSGNATSGSLTDLNLLAVALGQSINDVSVTASYTPRIWRRAGNYGNPPAAFPDTFYPISQVAYRRVSTQNTRKR